MNRLLLVDEKPIRPHAVKMILSASSDFSTIQNAINEIEVFREHFTRQTPCSNLFYPSSKKQLIQTCKAWHTSSN